jgi:uncharacterized membrane protein
MDSDRAMERLIFFTDAVAAIAITLLILPLVDTVPQFAEHHSLSQFIGDNGNQLFAFTLSFVIIARLWLSNHQILANTMRATKTLMWIDLVWAFTIVVLPLPTEITAVFPTSLLSVSIYIACTFASTLALTALALYLYRHPELERTHTRISGMQLWGTASTAACFIIAFGLLLIFPRITFYSLLALLLATPATAIVGPRIRRHAAKRIAAEDALEQKDLAKNTPK